MLLGVVILSSCVGIIITRTAAPRLRWLPKVPTPLIVTIVVVVVLFIVVLAACYLVVETIVFGVLLVPVLVQI